jgi:plasmid maintenance system killer protein
MITHFRNLELKIFDETGESKFSKEHEFDLAILLDMLDSAKKQSDMNIASLGEEYRYPDEKGHWSIPVYGRWCLTYTFDSKCDAIEVDHVEK